MAKPQKNGESVSRWILGGRVVFLQKEYSNLDGNQENQVFTSGLKNGLYFLQADIGNEIFKTKFIVLH